LGLRGSLADPLAVERNLYGGESVYGFADAEECEPTIRFKCFEAGQERRVGDAVAYLLGGGRPVGERLLGAAVRANVLRDSGLQIGFDVAGGPFPRGGVLRTIFEPPAAHLAFQFVFPNVLSSS
jgi:hypothetical protein